MIIAYKALNQSLASQLTAAGKPATVCLYLPRIYKVVMTSLQSSTEAANRLPKEQQNWFCFTAFLQTFHFAACFSAALRL